MLERVEVEVRAELAVEHAEDVAVERGGHACTVVVGGDQTATVLHEIGAEQEPVVVLERGVEVEQEPAALRRCQVADGAPEEGDDAPPVLRNGSEMALEVTDD